jgi:hypothetical protein
MKNSRTCHLPALQGRHIPSLRLDLKIRGTKGMKTSKALTLGAALASLFGLAAEANATYVTYDFAGGTMTVSATISAGGGPAISILSAGVLQFTGGDVVFDPSAPSLQLQSFSLMGATASPMTLIGPLAGDMLSVSALTLGPGSSYAVSGFGGADPYHFLVTSIAASGGYNLTGSVFPAPLSGSFNNPGVNNSSIAATVTLASLGGTDWLGLTGVSLGSFTIGSGVNQETVTLQGNLITFDVAPVPLPGALWLFVSGLGLLGFPFIRRSRAMTGL